MFYQKHLGILFDEKLNFKQHTDSAISKVNKGISVIKKVRHNLPRKSLVTIHKAFLRPLIETKTNQDIYSLKSYISASSKPSKTQ